MPRGAYDTTISDELRRHRQGSSSQRLQGNEGRDAAVRRMNIRRGKRTGEGGSNSTAYTPGRTGSGSPSKSGDEGHEDTPRRKSTPPTKRQTTPDSGPILEDKPVGPDDDDSFSGYPILPGYTPPGKTAPIEPPPGSPGGGDPLSPGPPSVPDAVPINVPISLLPLLAAAGLSSGGGRNAMRAYPSPQEVQQSIMTPQRSVGGVPAIRGDDIVDAEFEPYRDPMGLPPPAAQQPPPDPRLMAAQEQLRLPPPAEAAPAPPMRALPPPTEEPINIPLGDPVKEKVETRIRQERKQKTSGAKDKFKKKLPRIRKP